jgi:hypothetical protein
MAFELLQRLLCFAPLVGCLAVSVLAHGWMHSRIAALEAVRPGQAGMFGDVVPAACIFVLSAWPLALPLGLFWLVRRPGLARQGRIFVFYFMCWVLAWVAEAAVRLAFAPLPE